MLELLLDFLFGVPDGVQLALTGLEIALLTAGTASTAAGLFGDDGSPSGSSLNRQIARRPQGSGALGDQLNLQALLQLGAPVQDIRDMLFVNRITEVSTPAQARNLVKILNAARNAANSGNTRRAQTLVNRLNTGLRRAVSGSVAPGLELSVGLEDGEVTLTFGDELEGQLAQLDTGDTFRNRARALENLSEVTAGVPAFTEEEIREREAEVEAALLARLADSTQEQREREIATAARLGVAPRFDEINEQEALLRSEITSDTALRRALALSQGQVDLSRGSIDAIQAGLNPTLSPFALSAQQLSQGSQSAGLSFAANIAALDAQAQQTRNQSFLGLGEALIGGALTSQASGSLQDLIEQIELSRIPGAINSDELLGRLGVQRRT